MNERPEDAVTLPFMGLSEATRRNLHYAASRKRWRERHPLRSPVEPQMLPVESLK